MNDTNPELDPLTEFDRQAPVAYVETDRFCDGCGYNLRTQPVRTDARTALLLCRCPECGRFQPARDGATAGSAWLKRLGLLLLFVWILAIGGGGIGLGAAQVGATLLTLEELTTYRQVRISPRGAAPSVAANAANPTSTIVRMTPGGVVLNTGGTTTTWRREIREDLRGYRQLMVLAYGLSFGLGFLLALMAVVVFCHWRRWGYLVPVTLVPIGAGALVWYTWRVDVPHLLDWATPFIVSQAAVHLAGGLTGILLGRPLARLIVTLTLPAGLRQVVAFLWLADGKRPPAVASAPRAPGSGVI